MATTHLDIIIDNQTSIKGPLSINLHLIEDKAPVKLTMDGKTTSSTQKKPNEFKINGIRVILAITLIICITFTILFGYIFGNHLVNGSEKSNLDEGTNLRIVEKGNLNEGKILRIVSRDEWNARPEAEPLTSLNLPVHRVIIAHSATSDCTSQAECSSATQNIQTFHMDSKNFADIAYNFLVGGDGAVYEGRGYDKQGVHTKGFNEDSICIAFIGTFTRMKPTEGQLNAAKLIIAEGVRLKKLAEDYRLYGTRQFMGSESPGQALYEIIRTWPHWSGKPY